MEELEKRGNVRALLAEPPALLGERVRLEEQAALGFLERRAPESGARKAADAYRTVHRLARREMRRPGPVIERGGRGDLALVQLRQALRDDARVRLRPADHLRAVPLDDDENLHSCWFAAGSGESRRKASAASSRAFAHSGAL